MPFVFGVSGPLAWWCNANKVDMVFGYAPPSQMIDHLVILAFGLLILYPTLLLKLIF